MHCAIYKHLIGLSPFFLVPPNSDPVSTHVPLQDTWSRSKVQQKRFTPKREVVE